MSGAPVLEIRKLEKWFGWLHVLRGVDLVVQERDVVSVVGPSGSGKSTLLRCINRLESPTRGQIFLSGEDITTPGMKLVAVRRQIGMVFQQFNLFPHMTALQNVMEGPLTALRMPRPEAEAVGIELLRKVGLEHKAGVRPAQLSGGQQQRVAIARALAMKPRIMLFDEPTSALDPELAVEVLRIMRQLAEEGMTMLVVSHEMPFVRGVSTRLVMLDDGGVLEEGPTGQVFDSPRHERTGRFLGQFQW
jgi:ABC-type polar amino acid transport system ATPase subunit